MKKVNNTFNLPMQFKNIKKSNRLKYLISCLRINKPDAPVCAQVARRRGFDFTKGYKFPLENTICYVCSSIATIRHHVRPLSKGGKNKRNNIVPLCHKCHCSVHPHMQKGYKKEDRIARGPALVKPKQEIVVIPPNYKQPEKLFSTFLTDDKAFKNPYLQSNIS